MTGWVVAIPILNKGFTAKKAALLVHHCWLDIFGIPTTIVTDLGPNFAGAWFRSFCGLLGIHHATSLAYRHNTNGRAEQAIDQVLAKLAKIHQEQGLCWTKLLPVALRRIHDTPGPAGISPYRALFGRDRLQEGLPLPLERECEDAVQWHKDMVKADQQLAEKLNFLHQQRQKGQKEARKPPDFKIGATVWVLRPPGGGSKIHSK